MRGTSAGDEVKGAAQAMSNSFFTACPVSLSSFYPFGRSPTHAPRLPRIQPKPKMKHWILLSFLLAICPQIACAQPLTAGENRSLLIASQRYPDLQRESTAHYTAYQNLLKRSIDAKSVVFKDPNWPLVLAEKSRASLTATQQGPRRVGRTDVEKYESVISKMLKSSDPVTRQYGSLEHSAHQAELAGDTARAAEIRASLAELQALGRIEALLNQVNSEIWRIKQELRIP
jgi:hypothetical protein